MGLYSRGIRFDLERREDRFLDHKPSEAVFCEAAATVANQ